MNRRLKKLHQRRQRSANSNSSLQQRRLKEERQLSLTDMWARYRPLQAFLDTRSPEDQARLLHSSRVQLFERLITLYGPGALELRGDTLHLLESEQDSSIPLL